MITYAVGDIHGCYNELIQMVDILETDACENPFQIVFLGDYIDRGPNSAAVLEFLMNYKHGICLLGNHEDMMLSDDMHKGWLAESSYGGVTMASYLSNTGNYEKHVEWLKNRPLYHIEGNNLFVHAGTDPTLSMDDQYKSVLLWSRNFNGYKNQYLHGKYVVHGHTPQYEISQTDTTLNLDTACCFGGKLSAARMGSWGPVKFFQVKNQE